MCTCQTQQCPTVCFWQIKKIGFNHFVGIDGSKSMMDKARNTGLYRDLKMCVLGEQDLPVKKGAVVFLFPSQ